LIAHPEQSNATQLAKRAFFDLPNALSADTEHSGDFLDGVFPFARHDERAVARRLQTVLTVAAVLEVIAALGLAADTSAITVGAVANKREAARLRIWQFAAGLPRNAHASV
jgi:hypothetical protein